MTGRSREEYLEWFLEWSRQQRQAFSLEEEPMSSTEIADRDTHAHVTWSSRDCDGLTDGSHTINRNQDEDWLDFRNRVLWLTVSVTPASGCEGTLIVRRGPEKDMLEFNWTETTEEGHANKQVEFCSMEECIDLEPTYRDHSAEAMGY